MSAFQISGPVAPVDGWIASGETWTRTANTTFTVSGDLTAIYSPGTRLKWTQTTVKYGVVASSAHAAGTTTVTIATTPDYVLTAAAITQNYYSYAGNPQGYPGWFNFTPTWGGFSADPSGGLIRFAVDGRTVIYNVNPGSDGTSNATTLTVTAPIANTAAARAVAQGRNSGADLTTPSSAQISGATITVFRDNAGAAWTASGGKRAMFTLLYEI